MSNQKKENEMKKEDILHLRCGDVLEIQSFMRGSAVKLKCIVLYVHKAGNVVHVLNMSDYKGKILREDKSVGIYWTKIIGCIGTIQCRFKS